MLLFDLPPTKGHSVAPLWDGRCFVFGDQSTPVLEYSENFAGWSDDLSTLHEETVGDTHPIDLASRKDALRQVKKFMPVEKAVIMDIGCSSGYLIRDLVESFPEAVIIGADVVKEPLYRLAKDFPGIPLIRFDLLRCPLPDQSVDVLVMLNVLEHIEDDLGALQKAYNLLKPGGVLVIEVPACPNLYDAYDRELRHFRRYSATELNGKLSKAGFKVCRKSYLGFVLFPAFAAVKLLNKWLSSGKNQSVVREQAKSTSINPLVKWSLEFESKYLSNFQLPYGIRVLAVAMKQGNHSSKYPKIFPPLSIEQTAISHDFLRYWHEVLPRRYKIADEFGHHYAVKTAPPEFLRTLEIGAGNGEHLRYEKLTPEQRANYVAVDIRENMIAELRNRFPDIRAVVGDCQRAMNFEDGCFDRIVAIHVLEHLPDLPAAVKEMHRLCDKNRGVLSVVIPCEGSLAYSMARKISAQRIFEARYKTSYQWFIEREHINRPYEIFEELSRYFTLDSTTYFPVPLKVEFCNLCIGATFRPKRISG